MERLAFSYAFIKVVELDQDAATALFIKSAGLNEPGSGDLAHTKAMVRELGYLPLAVDQTAVSITSGLCQVDEYLNICERYRLRSMDNLTFKGASTCGRTVYTTWNISFADLAMGNLAIALREVGELGEAKPLQVQALTKWCKEHLGLKHVHTVHTMRDLAYTLESLGEIRWRSCGVSWIPLVDDGYLFRGFGHK
jgi:hypothetical protein